MKKIFNRSLSVVVAFVLCLTTFVACLTVSAATDGTGTITVGTVKANPGQAGVVVPVTLKKITGNGIAAARFQISFDSTKLKLKAVASVGNHLTFNNDGDNNPVVTTSGGTSKISVLIQSGTNITDISTFNSATVDLTFDIISNAFLGTFAINVGPVGDSAAIDACDSGTIDNMSNENTVKMTATNGGISLIPQEMHSTVSYNTHVQDIGWQTYVSDGQSAGTSGLSKRLEGIHIKIDGEDNLGVTYSTHIQDIGWQSYVSDDQMSGTSGQSKRLEAIKIKLTGADAQYFDIYYRVHVQDRGWLSWAKNDNPSGTEGFGQRLEAIQIKIFYKDTANLDTAYPFITSKGFVSYQTHVQDYGWQDNRKDGESSGTTGQSKRLEGIRISLNPLLPSGSINYSCHVQDYGWMGYVSNGQMSGTSGQSKRLEAISIYLSGDIATKYDIYYRVHAQEFGWLGWACNGQNSGTAGFGYRLEGIQIVLVPKGGSAPSGGGNSFVSKY